MKKTCRFLCLILFLCLNQGLVKGETIKPIERFVGKLHISIDPRMEILSVIQLLSDYPVINRNMIYSQDILKHFESFSSHRAVKLTDSLLQKTGFSYDAPVTFMLHLSQPPELETQIKFSDYLLIRGGEGNNLEQYRESIKQFANESNFENFWNSKVSFYNQILDMTIAEMGGIDFVEVLEGYFNESQSSYNIVISPAFAGGYGPNIADADGKVKIYACLSTTLVQDGIPYLNRDGLLYYIWHEFGHSFINPLSEKYIDRIASVNKLFEPIREKMTKQAYDDWETCVNEHIIRAITIRLYEQNFGTDFSKRMLNRELRNRFIYIEPLIEKLKYFENQRNVENITFSDFYTELINVWEGLLKTEYWKQIDLSFKGPVNEVSMEEKIVVIYPTHDLDMETLKIAQDYATAVFDQFFKQRGGLLMADTTALKNDLSEYGIIAYGTVESNLFLKQYALSFPFKIENQTIYADKEYTDKNIKFISCVPNPQNPQKGMTIYTALSNRSIQGINNVYHGREDYILFLNRETVFNKGFYNKNEKWTF